MANDPALVLLIEDDPALRDINTQILSEAGYQVEHFSHHEDCVTIAETIKPDVIVIGIRPSVRSDRIIIEDLQSSPRTHAIPVVVIATTQEVLATVTTLPNVRQVVVAPYHIETLETAVARTLGRFSAIDTTSDDRLLLRLPG